MLSQMAPGWPVSTDGIQGNRPRTKRVMRLGRSGEIIAARQSDEPREKRNIITTVGSGSLLELDH